VILRSALLMSRFIMNSASKSPIAMMTICLLMAVAPISASRIEDTDGENTLDVVTWGGPCTHLFDTFRQQMHKLPTEPADTTRTQMRVLFRMWSVARTLRRAQSRECAWMAALSPEELEPLLNVGTSMRDGPCASQAQEILTGVQDKTEEEQVEAFTRAMRVSVSPDCTTSDVSDAKDDDDDDDEDMVIEEGDELVEQVTDEMMMADSSFLETSNQPLALALLFVGVLLSAFVLAIALGVLCGVFQYALMFIVSVLVCGFRRLVGVNDNFQACFDLALERFQTKLGQRLRVATCAIPVAYGTTMGTALAGFGLSYAIAPLAAR